MGVFDTTMVDVAAKGAISAPLPADGDKPAAEGVKPTAEETKPDGSAESRPAATELISGILDKHGLTSAEELGEFIDNLTSLKGKIGDEDPEELLKAKQTLQTYHKEWAKQEREKLREKETPEETISRLEKELRDEQARKAKSEDRQRKAESAKQALKSYGELVAATAASDASIPEEYHPFLKELMGVESPVNQVNIVDRAAVKKLTREHGIRLLKNFEQLVIKRYRDGKADIPRVPPAASANPPVTGETKPKNLSESRILARNMLSRLWGGGRG